MLRFHFGGNRKNKIIALIYLVLSIGCCLLGVVDVTTDFSALPAYQMPFFIAFQLLVVASLLFVVRSGATALRMVCKALALCGIIFMLLYGSELLNGGDVFRLAVNRPAAFFFGFFILLALLALFFAITSNLRLSVRILTILIFVYSIVSYFVLRFRGTVFIPEDILAVGTALEVVGNYRFTLTWDLAASVLTFIGIFLIAAKIQMHYVPVVYGATRFAALLFAFAFLCSTVTKEHISQLGVNPDYWNQLDSANSNGSIVNFVAGIPYTTVSAPDNYSPEAVYEIAAKYPSDSVDDATLKPDVILILGESWADLTSEGLAETNIPTLPNFTSFQEREDGLFRNLMVSTFGGGTSSSEYQMFVGTNLEYGMHSAPFQYNVHEGIPNIVASFKQLGYQTTAMHTGTGTAWSRDSAFPILGFDEFYSEVELVAPDSQLVRYYPADAVMYDKALELLAQAEEPQFIYCITIQTHGGYEYEFYDSPIEIKTPDGSYPQAEQYLGLMHEADQQFGALIEALEQRERPTIVLAYGDHLPSVEIDYLKKIRSRWLEENDFVEDAAFWDAKTFSVMWANFPLQKEDMAERSDYASLNYLGVDLLQAAGLPLTGYQKFLQECARQFPVVSVVGYLNAEDKYVSAWTASDTELYQQQALLQYNLINDPENYPPNFYTLSES